MPLDMETSFKNLSKIASQSETALKEEMLSQWWQRITDAYSEPQRYYHTIDHITSMWELYDSTLQGADVDSSTVRFAIIFHEYIHSPKFLLAVAGLTQNSALYMTQKLLFLTMR